MATINGDFSIGNAYEYKPLQIPNMDKVFDGQRWAIERVDRLKKEADAAAERKALKEAELAKDRNAEIAKEQTLLAQRLKFNATGLHPEAEALVAKEIDRLSTIGGALGNINDMTRPEVRQWNQEVDKLTNRIYEHQQYYKDLGKATTDYQAAVLEDKDLEPYNPQENYEYYQTILGNEGLNFSNPYTTRPIREKPPLYTAADLAKLHKEEAKLVTNKSIDDKGRNLGNFRTEYTNREVTTADVNNSRSTVMGLQQKLNDGEELNKEEKKRLISEQRLAAAKGFVDESGNITDEYWSDLAKQYSKSETSESTEYHTPYTPPKTSDGDNTGKFIRQFYGNSLIMGTKTTPVAAMPAQSDINAGKNTKTGADYLLEPAAEITGTKMNNLPGNTLGANSAWKIGKDGTITPIKSNQDIGGITTDRIVYFPTDEQGRPPMSYQNSKTGANKNSSGRFANSGRNYQAFAYKTDENGSVIVVNLHKSFNGTLSERGIATELTPQEIDQINGRNQVQQPQTPQVKTEQKPQRDGKFNGVKIPGVN